jgi:hypothetical protein
MLLVVCSFDVAALFAKYRWTSYTKLTLCAFKLNAPMAISVEHCGFYYGALYVDTRTSTRTYRRIWATL